MARASGDPRAMAEAVLRLDASIRYVAVAAGAEVTTVRAPGRANVSGDESDYYEERLVNPTMLELARRRGAEGCGGFDFLVIGYGFFHQLVIPSRGGHVSVCLEPSADPIGLVEAVRTATAGLGSEPQFLPPVGPAPSLSEVPLSAWDEAPDPRGEALVAALYAAHPGVRYVALNRRGRLVLSTRVGDFIGPDRSDRYEELLVNPSLLAMASARGAIDCGGLRFVVVVYPSFHALVLPLEDGHATVSLPRSEDAVAMAPRFGRAIAGI